MTRYGDLEGKVVLVTGGSRGLGREMVQAFHSEGCKVALNYNSSRKQAQSIVNELGNTVEAFRGDVASRESVRNMVRKIEKSLGSVDILVNNAGISYPMEFENVDESKFEIMWRVNVVGTINTSIEVLPGMKRSKKGGVIINIASHAGVGNPRPYSTFYATTKSAVIILTKRMAMELGEKYGIRVNAIAPGVIRTDSQGLNLNESQELKFEQQLGLRRVLKLKGLPKHIADTALFLASNSSEFIAGQVITVDGGRLDSLPRSL